MLNARERQEQEIKTIKKREIKIQLSDSDCIRLSNMAAGGGMTIAELLSNFICDLVDGTNSNGSDERMCAEQWFDRCGFRMVASDSLLKYLIDNGYDPKEYIEYLDDIAKAEEDLIKFKEHPEEYDAEEISFLDDDIESWKEEIAYMMAAYVKENPNYEVRYETELNKIKDWIKEKENMMD